MVGRDLYGGKLKILNNYLVLYRRALRAGEDEVGLADARVTGEMVQLIAKGKRRKEHRSTVDVAGQICPRENRILAHLICQCYSMCLTKLANLDEVYNDVMEKGLCCQGDAASCQ